jgi:glycosyltransferase involved in cell wall biosynthesis
MNSSNSTYGIVIPTFNEERNLARLLASIRAQSGSSYSVVVVDQGSTDRTVEIAKSFGCTVISEQRAHFYTPPARSRNRGAQSVTADLLLHLDADMELASPRFLHDAAAAINSEHQALIIEERDIASGFLARCKALERSCYRATRLEAARLATRALFEAIGGYDDDISTGEDQYVTRLYELATNVARAKTLVVNHHTGPYSLRRLLAKKFSYGRTARTYLRKAADIRANSAASIAWISVAAYLANWRLGLQHPVLYLAIFPVRAMELAAVCAGMCFPASEYPRRAEHPAQYGPGRHI